jgi:hypothetical protein
MEPVSPISGTSGEKFPKRRISAHIHAYRRRQAPIAPAGNLLQINGFWCCTHQRAGVVAMQKVVGSNPISRFFANPLHVGGSGSARSPKQDQTIPAYRLHFGH